MMSTNYHALVFGASGISGWALVKEALSYPTPTTFSQVTALSNRPLSLSDAQWPDDPRLQLTSEIDLTHPTEKVVEGLKEKVKNVDTVTHVFLFLYLDPGKDHKTLVEVNTNLIRTAVEAAQRVSPKIKSFILQTGGKAYGLGMFNLLLVEPSSQ
jgi:nucleoside-diphosphate-sugar epimerase